MFISNRGRETSRMTMRLASIGMLFIFLILISSILTELRAQQLWGMTSDGGSKTIGGNIFSIGTDGTGFIERYAFFKDASVVSRQSLLDYGDGFLYGLTVDFIFKLKPDGTKYQIVYHFQQETGAGPASGLIKGIDGYIYGTTNGGGSKGLGTVYKVKQDGTDYQVLHNFNGPKGKSPSGKLIQFSNGKLFGTTAAGGANQKGTVYKLDPDGANFEVLHSFSGNDGSGPSGGVVSISINNITFLYGITTSGGTNDKGVIYRVGTGGGNFSVELNFSDARGFDFIGSSGPLLKINGIFYGTARDGGSNGTGVIYSFNPDNAIYKKLRDFPPFDQNNPKPYNPVGPLININGVLYGTTENGREILPQFIRTGVIYKINTDGTGYKNIANLPDGNSDGSSNLLFFNNHIFGVTFGGIISASNDISLGSIYKLKTDGSSLSVIHTFDWSNGFSPSGSLTRGQDGNLYGLTTFGGTGWSNGLAFSIKTDGTNFTPLHSTGIGLTTGNPEGSMIQATDGSFYGLDRFFETGGNGSIFKMTMGTSVDFQFYTPFTFPPGSAAAPTGSLIEATNGDLFGMTTRTSDIGSDGTIFRINKDGTGFIILHRFIPTSEGGNPGGSLIQASDGALYGMAENGAMNGFGSIFKIQPDGSGFQRILEFGHDLIGSFDRGTHPHGSLIEGSDFKLYGMARGGGSNLGGTIFRVNRDGTGFEVIHNFDGINGLSPGGSLIQDISTGFLYGMTELGGTNNMGIIFKIMPDGTGFQKLLDFNGVNGKYPKGDLLLVAGTPTPITNQKAPAQTKMLLPDAIHLISVSPNPVTNYFNVHLQTAAVGKVIFSLMDTQGKIIQKRIIDSHGSLQERFDMHGLPKGMYVVKIVAAGQQFTKKIIKQ